MTSVVNVAVHPSRFPENVRRDLLQSLRSRVIDPKLHYVTYNQAQKWLALHEAFSPSRTDADCAAIYDRAFQAAAKALNTPQIHLIGLGCGGGQKEARLLTALTGQGRELSYTPADISLPLVLTSMQAAQKAVPGIKCHPLVCDFATAEDLPAVFDGAGVRLITFFGMVPNFEPELILPKLAGLLRPGDLLLLSANLAPGADYAAGVQKVLPGYDNQLTRDWLMTFLQDLGVGAGEGDLRFSIEKSPSGLLRIVADFIFNCARTLVVDGERFEFRISDKVRLFFSYRYTPDRVAALLKLQNVSIIDQWITSSGEEGIFCAAGRG